MIPLDTQRAELGHAPPPIHGDGRDNPRPRAGARVAPVGFCAILARVFSCPEPDALSSREGRLCRNRLFAMWAKGAGAGPLRLRMHSEREKQKPSCHDTLVS